MSKFSVVILAAGQGKRFHSRLPKVYHKICGKPMVNYIVDASRGLHPQRILMVVQRNMKHGIEGVDFVTQEEPRGTGDALLSAMPSLQDVEKVLVLPGDVPLVTTSSLRSLIHAHGDNSCTILTMIPDDPSSYGRIVKDERGVVKIVEERDATLREKAIKEVNTAIYMFNTKELSEVLHELTPDNVQREYYLTDVIGIMRRNGYKVGAFISENNIEITGINDRNTLWFVTKVMEENIIKTHRLNGVTIHEPVCIDYGVEIGRDTVILPFTSIYGRTQIGEGCTVGPNVVIMDSKIPKGRVIEPFTFIKDMR